MPLPWPEPQIHEDNDAVSNANNFPCFTHKELLVVGPVATKVPVEVWTRVRWFLTPAGFVILGSILAQAMSAAADIARFPLVEEFRLVDVVASGSVLPIPETTESTYYDHDETTERANGEDIRQYYYELGCAKFTAVRGVVILTFGRVKGHFTR